jgi:hypothetical protein
MIIGNQNSAEETADGALQRKNLDDAPKEKLTAQNEKDKIENLKRRLVGKDMNEFLVPNPIPNIVVENNNSNNKRFTR